MNPVSDITAAIECVVQAHRLDEWLKFLLGFVVSGLVTFLGAGGGMMVYSVHQGIGAAVSLVVGLGSGMVSAAPILALYFVTSPQTKGIRLLLPKSTVLEQTAAEADAEVQTPTGKAGQPPKVGPA